MFDVIAARQARDLVEGQFGSPRPPRRRPAPRTRRGPKAPVTGERSA
jgi:hypothetical protein